MELSQFDTKRQVLHQQAFIGIQKHYVGTLPFRNIDITAERYVPAAQNALGFKIFGIYRLIVRHDTARPNTQFQQQITVNQTAQTDHNQRSMGENIAPFVHSAFFCRHQHRTVRARN